MALKIFHIAVDCHDPHSLARFWCEALDWKILLEDPDGVIVGADDRSWPGMVFLPVPEDKRVKNRLHLDFSPDDQDAEVERLLALGARRADVGQGEDVSWVVMTDPEGNEFCVLRPKTTLTD